MRKKLYRNKGYFYVCKLIFKFYTLKIVCKHYCKRYVMPYMFKQNFGYIPEIKRNLDVQLFTVTQHTQRLQLVPKSLY